jgi:hypothetical protein
MLPSPQPPSNFDRGTLTDERRPPPPPARRGAPLSGPPRPQLTPHRASPHRPEAPRPLPRRPRPPEHHPRRSPPPSAALLSSRRRYSPPRPDPEHPQVCNNVVMLPHPSTLAAGDCLRRIWPVNPRASPLTTAKDLGWEDTKAQGAICKA